MNDRPRRACPAPLLVAAVLAAVCGCGTADIPVLSLVDSAEGGAPRADAATGDGALPAIDSLSDFCSGSGPPLLIDAFADGGAVSTCPEQLAQRAFLYALCLCNDYVSDHALFTDAFNGSQGAYDSGAPMTGGSVGVNGDLHPTGPMQIHGSLWASDSTDITASTVEVAGELHAEGEMRPTSLTVGADAWMANGIQTSGDVTIGGAVHVPSGAPIDIAGTSTFGPPVTTPFPPVASACNCEPSEFVDVAGVVATYAAHNDDAMLNIDPKMFENVQAPVTMTMPCGRIYFTTIAANDAPIQLTVTSHVAIFVSGDISTSDFEIDVPTGGELDLFVAGTIVVRGSFLVGSPSNPARARTYVGGGTVNLQSAATLAGNLYAPNAQITLGGSAPTTLYGSIFASELSAGADLTIHYDEAILTQSSTPACPAQQSCTTCADCGGQACNSGTCGLCVDSSDCCAPLVCGSQGTCVSDIVAP
jgi:hypothetical protein